MYQKNPGPIVTYKNESEVVAFVRANRLERNLDQMLSDVSQVVPNVPILLDLVVDPDDGTKTLFLCPIFSGSTEAACKAMDDLAGVSSQWPLPYRMLVGCSLEFA